MSGLSARMARLCSAVSAFARWIGRRSDPLKRRDKQVAQRGRELIELVSSRLPQEHTTTGDADAFAAVGVALMARMTTTLSFILEMLPTRRMADAAVLARSLYEHAVHFAWLAAQPDAARLERWRKNDLRRRIAAERDMRSYGQGVMADQALDRMKAEEEGLSGAEIVLEQIADESDKYWAGKIDGLDPSKLRSFGGLYAVLYRQYSPLAHPSMMGLNRVAQELGGGRHRISLEREFAGWGPYSPALMVFGLALFVSSKSLGWPEVQEVDAVFAREPWVSDLPADSRASGE